MITVKKYLKLLSCTNEDDLDTAISTMSDDDAKAFVRFVILYLQKHSGHIDVSDILDRP